MAQGMEQEADTIFRATGVSDSNKKWNSRKFKEDI